MLLIVMLLLLMYLFIGVLCFVMTGVVVGCYIVNVVLFNVVF